MKIQTITYSKQYKMSLGNYSNITAGMSITIEVEEGEEIDHEAFWDLINGQIFNQTDLDPGWIKKEDLKDFTKYILKIPLLRLKRLR